MKKIGFDGMIYVVSCRGLFQDDAYRWIVLRLSALKIAAGADDTKAKSEL